MPKRVYNWHRQDLDPRDFLFTSVAPTTTDFDLRPSMPAPYNQGTIGDCSSASTSAAFQFSRLQEGTGGVFSPSLLFLYYCERSLMNTIGTDSGSTNRNAVKALSKFGTVPQRLWPQTKSYLAVPSKKAYRRASKNKGAAYHAVPQTDAGIQAALSTNLPVIFGFAAYSELESPEVATSGVLPLPASNSSFLGGHSVLIVGYISATDQYIVRNSWGPAWGLEGYFLMPGAYVRNPALAADFWVITAPKAA